MSDICCNVIRTRLHSGIVKSLLMNRIFDPKTSRHTCCTAVNVALIPIQSQVKNGSKYSYAPINGMPHLAYLGQMLEKEGEFGIGIFPEGLVLSWDCQNES